MNQLEASEVCKAKVTKSGYKYHPITCTCPDCQESYEVECGCGCELIEQSDE